MSDSFDKLSILDSFIEEVDSYLPEIEANLDRLAQDVQTGQPTSDMDVLEETYRRAHTIGGSASMMDLAGLAHIAQGMEDILADALEELIVLDAPTIALLQRSFGRLRLLLNGVRGGVDENALVEEDDADYEQYQAMYEQAHSAQGMKPAQATYTTQAGQTTQATPPVPANSFEPSIQPTVPMSPLAAALQPHEPGLAPSLSSPSFDEVLASFRTPSLDDADMGWPEEVAEEESTGDEDVTPVASPLSSSFSSSLSPLTHSVAQEEELENQEEYTPVESAVHEQHVPATPVHFPEMAPASAILRGEEDSRHEPSVSQVPQQSALEELVASTASMSQSSAAHEVQAIEPITSDERRRSSPTPAIAESQLPQSYAELQRDAQSLENQAASMQRLVSQLRSAMGVIEEQRGEFKGFLDGSKDALDRMEDWAGKAMGLNLRNSPEKVRKYLPLSVMWVANTKLKKVLELLNQITNGVAFTDEQMQVVIEHLQSSISACGDAFREMQDEVASATRILSQENGWSPWEMQATRSGGNGLQERVTFERYGNVDEIREQVRQELRQEVEGNIREELEREYNTFSLASRAELEQKIRNEVRLELEANRRLQEQASGVDVQLVRQELERQLRNEIEIQVRQDFLDRIANSNGNTNVASAQGLVPSPEVTTSTQTADAQKQTEPQHTRQQDDRAVHSVIPASASAQAPLPATPTVASTPSMSNDFVEEAAEIFRVEAEEYLQTISTSVAALEKEPTNREYVQEIRRAMHTLKGAAGMMGFRTVAELSHISEDLLDSIVEGESPISSQVLSVILDTAETLDALISGKSDNNVEEQRVRVLHNRYARLLGEQADAHATDGVGTAQGTLDDDIEADEEEQVESGTRVDTAPLAGIAASVSSQPPVEIQTQRSAHHDLSVRVHLQKLDELVNLFGELLVNRSILEERIQRLVRLVADVGISSNRLRDVGQRLESRFEAATLPSGRSLVVMPGDGNTPESPYHNGRQSEPAHLADFDVLEMDRYTEFHQLARGLSEGISDMSTLSTEMDAIIRECESVFARENRLSTTFQDRLMKTRLVPLSTMTPRLDRAARAVAFKQGKEFEFTLEGGETEVDRTVYEEIAGPLLHLMRNAVNHGIETPDVRIQQGKSPKGHITLAASYESNQIIITVRDDGSGINAEGIRKAAIARGLIQPDQMLSEGEIIQLLFQPGFSTAEVVSEESGRGVGLDVVQDSVLRLRGTIEVESTPGRGTAFTMKFPTSLAIQSAMMVMTGGQQYAIPTTMIESIGRLDTFKRVTSGGQPAILVHDEHYPLSMLAQYLHVPVGQITEKSHVLLVHTGGSRVALVIDEVKGKLDIVVKNLGSHLRNVRGIAGGTVLGNGQVVLILELGELLAPQHVTTASSTPGLMTTLPATESSTAQASLASASTSGSTAASASVTPLPRMPQTPALTSSLKSRVEVQPVAPSITKTPDATRPAANAERAASGKYILVVDDSPSVRRVVSNMLKQHEWSVQMARDGVEALELISRETPAAVLLDIEMPRMDGYELIATVRAQEQYRTLPLVVLTSRAATKHQQRAMQLGASGYVVKPYQDEELLNTINTLVYGAAVH